MYCSKCGKKIEDGSLFCPECGASQRTANNWQRGVPEASGGSGKAAIPFNTMCIIGAIVSGLSLFAPLVGIGGFILSRMGAKQVAETGERGRELAIAGMVVGGITGALTIILCIVIVLMYLGAISSLWFL